MLNYNKSITAVFLFFIFTNISANEIDCEVKGIQKSIHFKELQKTALQLNKSVCLSFFNPISSDFQRQQNNAFRDFGLAAKNIAITVFKPLKFENIDAPFDGFIQIISEYKLEKKELPALVVKSGRGSDRGKYIFYFHDILIRGEFNRSDNDVCKTSSYGVTCHELIMDFKNAINPYRYSYASKTSVETEKSLAKISKKWDKFLSEGRSQTIWDIGITTYLERKHFKTGYLVGPPVRQWSILHPSLVHESVRGAPDGHKNKTSVAIEWFGVNWWNKQSPFFGIPFGVSIASVYSDRPNINDVGHGLMFHFNNVYSIGWTNRNGEDGYYVSIDLLKATEDKKTKFNKYKKAF